MALPEFDMSDLVSRGYARTKQIARWAYEHGYQAIAYWSRHGAEYDCWAIFEGARYRPGEIAHMQPDDPDLQSVMALFGLQLSGQRAASAG